VLGFGADLATHVDCKGVISGLTTKMMELAAIRLVAEKGAWSARLKPVQLVQTLEELSEAASHNAALFARCPVAAPLGLQAIADRITACARSAAEHAACLKASAASATGAGKPSAKALAAAKAGLLKYKKVLVVIVRQAAPSWPGPSCAS